MKLKNWIKYLFKPEFYLRLQLDFVAGSSRQNVPLCLNFAESYMPFSSARRAAIYFCWGLFLAMPSVAFTQTNYYITNGPNYSIIGSLPGDQLHPDVALNAQGGYVVWQDNVTDPTGEGISAMRLDSTLSGSADVFKVNVTAASDQENARVALLKNGGAAFVWQGGPDNQQHIYARFLNQSSIWLNNTNVLVDKFTNNFQISPAVATLTNGNIIVVWTSFDQASSNSLEDIYGQMLSTNGTKIGTNFLINQFTTYNQRTPTVAALPNGGFVVAWVSEQERSQAPNWGNNGQAYATNALLAVSMSSVDIYERLYAISGTNAFPSTSEIMVNQDINPCSGPAVAVASDGSYMVTWSANNLTNETSSWDVYERSFTNSNGGPVYTVNSYTYGDQYNPRISAIGNEYLIVFTSLGQDGSREGVYGQFINEGDSPVGPEFLVNTTTVGQQMQQVVTSDGGTNFLAVWTSFTFGPNSFDLFAQSYSSGVLGPMAAPFVSAPFMLKDRVYQPRLVVSWPLVQSRSVSSYQVFVDGESTNIATVTSNEWAMTVAHGLTANSTHSFALRYVTSAGSVAPMSTSTSGTTWSGLTWGGIPYEWMEEYYGSDTSSWPSATSPVAVSGPTLEQVFMSGANPTNSATWLSTTLTKTPGGMFLNWNTQPGLTYQVQVTTNFVNWDNFESPRFESGTNDSIYLGNGGASYYRIQLLR